MKCCGAVYRNCCLVWFVEVVAEFSDRRTVLVDVLCPLDMQLVDEVNEYLSLQGIRDWSIGLAHLKALCMLLFKFF